MKKVKIIFAALCCVLFAGKAFATTTSNDVKEYSLKNGIPVYYIENNENSIDDVSIVVKGGRTWLKPEQSGLEKALFLMMSKGSGKYNYYKRLQISYEKTAGIFCSNMNNASAISLQCANYYLKELLPVLTDGFMNPTYPKQVYEMMMKDFSQDIQSTYNDPWSLMKRTVSDNLYKGHPYETSTSPTPDSLKNITIAEMKKLHKTVLDSRRICVIAITKMDPEELVEQLNSTLGTIKALNTPLPDVKVNDVVISGNPVILTNQAAAGTGYAAYAFQSPANTHEDYFAANLAASIYSTTMYNIVRSKYGVCYSTGSYTNGSAAAYGLEYFYMVSNLNDFQKAAEEARNIMASGKYVSKLNADGSYEFTPISEVLPGTKNSLINSIYSSATNTGGRAAMICTALIDYNDLNAYTSMIDKIHAVTTDDILRVFKKYWVDQPGRWFAVVGPESEKFEFN